jgi:HSP20 family protein
MADAMNRLFDARGYDYARNGGSNEHANGNSNGQTERAARLPLDAHMTDEAFVIQAYLPGVNPDTVEITFEGEELMIRGTFAPHAENANFVRRELYHGPFERKLTFNVPVDVEGIQAEFENGVLTLTVPKAEAVKPKQIKVMAK